MWPTKSLSNEEHVCCMCVTDNN